MRKNIAIVRIIIVKKANLFEIFLAANGLLYFFMGWNLSEFISFKSFTIYKKEDAKQNAIKDIINDG